MIKLLGSILVAGGAAFWGYAAAQGLRDRVRALEELEAGLRLLEQELELSAPELPRLMEDLSRRARGAAGELFSRFARALEELDRAPAAGLWARSVEGQERLIPEGRQCLLELGEVLGRYDSREQRACVAAVRTRLSALREEYAQSSRLRCRTFQTIGVSGGAFLVILLL